MHVVGLNVQLVNFKIMTSANFAYEVFDVASHAKEFHWIFGVFWLPHEVEAVLSNRMAEMF